MNYGTSKASGATGGKNPGSPELSRAAGVIEERTDEILAGYLGRLEEAGSLLLVGGGNPPE